MFRLRNILFLFIVIVFISAHAHEINSDSLRQILPTISQPSKKITIYNLLAKSYLKTDLTKSNLYAEQALFISESIEDSKSSGEALYYMAIYQLNQNNYNKALEYILESLDKFNNKINKKWKAKIYLVLGGVYHSKYEYEKSLDALFTAMNNFKEINAGKKLAETYNLIGWIYYDQGYYDKAFNYYYNSLIIWEKENDKPGMAKLYNNIGEIYRIKKENKEALKYFNKAIEINLNPDQNKFLAINYNNMGSIFIEEQNYEMAEHYLLQSLELINLYEITEWTPMINESLGQLYFKTNNIELSLNYFLNAYEISVQTSNLVFVKNAAKGLSEVYEIKDNYKLAYHYHQEYKQLHDSINNRKNQEKLAQQEMNLIFQQEQKITDIQREKNTMIYIIIASSLFTLLILFILLYGRQRIRNRHAKIKAENLMLARSQLKDEVDYKNRELATNVMYLVKKNELITFISDKLLKAKNKFKKENHKLIQETILNLKASVDVDIWNVFEERFSEVHKHFYDSLNKNFPKLTNNEKRLCALLRLNLSSKDIASIIHQNPGSVEVARTRLRKKLQITNKEINLVSFLSNL